MDFHTVYQLFSATYHSDQNLQKQAELQLKQIETNPGFISILLQILSSQESELGTRQANKEAFKRNIFHVLVTVPNVVRVQLLDSLGKVLSYDYPDKWQDFMSQVHDFLTNNNPNNVYIGLFALQQVIKVFQWRTKNRSNNEHIAEIIEKTFPIVLRISQGLINEISLDAAEMLRILIKIYSTATQYDLPAPLQNDNSLVPWVTLMLQLFEKPIPQEIIPNELDERQKFIWFRAQRWACRSLNRLFSRYGNPAQLPPSTKYGTFAENFILNFGPQILQTYLLQTERWIKKEIWLSDKILYFCSDFFKDAQTLVSQFLFPQLCFSDEDEELWVEDPVEYIHKKMDPLEDFTSPVSSAIAFLMDLAKHRKKHTFVNIMEFITAVLINYQNASPENKNPRSKDGALKMIGCLSDLILRKKYGVIHLMEGFLIMHVFPEFISEYPYLRARACDMLVKFNDIDFEHETTLATAFQGVTSCMNDTELPVKIQACLALQGLIHNETVRVALIPDLPIVMQKLLDLTNQIDSDTLSTVMEEFVEVFAKELGPFAVQLYFQNELAIPGKEDFEIADDLEIDDKTLAAAGVLKTISTLILSLESTPEVLERLENTLIPVVTFSLKNRISELYDDVFGIVDSCTFSTKKISPLMWEIFELIYKTFKGDNDETGIDYMEVFVHNSNLQSMIYDIIETVMKSDRLGEGDRSCACKLAESVLLNCRGYVDQLAFHYLPDLKNISGMSFKIHCIEIVINCLYYNPVLTLHNLEERGMTQSFFTLWFSYINKFSRVHDKKLVIVALCALIELPVEQLPHTLQAGWSQVLDGILEVFKSLPKAEEGDENVIDEDVKYLEFLAQEKRKSHMNHL
ncbi:10869_t:CDS:10 [Diversispora eburnea]|uniref:10869_t:CDS:1 n=3 Tax=Diversisporales TaxID=214509 RepID=A0A9N9APV2_9GLOM|nr:10869_t:CDS:10 [Diversispora eburnea]